MDLLKNKAQPWDNQTPLWTLGSWDPLGLLTLSYSYLLLLPPPNSFQLLLPPSTSTYLLQRLLLSPSNTSQVRQHPYPGNFSLWVVMSSQMKKFQPYSAPKSVMVVGGVEIAIEMTWAPAWQSKFIFTSFHLSWYL